MGLIQPDLFQICFFVSKASAYIGKDDDLTD